MCQTLPWREVLAMKDISCPRRVHTQMWRKCFCRSRCSILWNHRIGAPKTAEECKRRLQGKDDVCDVLKINKHSTGCWARRWAFRPEGTAYRETRKLKQKSQSKMEHLWEMPSTPNIPLGLSSAISTLGNSLDLVCQVFPNG